MSSVYLDMTPPPPSEPPPPKPSIHLDVAPSPLQEFIDLARPPTPPPGLPDMPPPDEPPPGLPDLTLISQGEDDAVHPSVHINTAPQHGTPSGDGVGSSAQLEEPPLQVEPSLDIDEAPSDLALHVEEVTRSLDIDEAPHLTSNADEVVPSLDIDEAPSDLALHVEEVTPSLAIDEAPHLTSNSDEVVPSLDIDLAPPQPELNADEVEDADKHELQDDWEFVNADEVEEEEEADASDNDPDEGCCQFQDPSQWLPPLESEIATTQEFAIASGGGGASSSTAPSPQRVSVEVGGTFQALKGARLWKLSYREAFDRLGPKQRTYLYNLSEAVSSCARVVLAQTSPESLKIAELLQTVCSDKAYEKVKPEGAVTDAELASFHDYLVKFWANLGNYDAETGWKFVPHMEQEAFEKVVVRHCCFLNPSKRQHALELLEELLMPIFSLQEEDRQGHCLPRFGEEDLGLKRVFQAIRGAIAVAPDMTHRQALADLLASLGETPKLARDDNIRDGPSSASVEVDFGFTKVGRSQGDALPGDRIYRQIREVAAELTGLLSLKVERFPSKALKRVFSRGQELQRSLPWPEAFNDPHCVCPELQYLDVVSFAGPFIGSIGWVELSLDEKKPRSQPGRHFLLRNMVAATVAAATAADMKEPFLADADLELARRSGELSAHVQAALEVLTSCSGRILRPCDIEKGCVMDPLSGEPITECYLDDEPWAARFGRLAEVLEVCRRIAGGLYLCVADGLDGAFCDDENQDKVAACSWLCAVRSGLGALAFRRAPADEPSEALGWGLASHARARFSILATLVNSGEDLVKFEADGSMAMTVTLDRNQIRSVGRQALQRLLQRIQVFKSTGNVKEATRFFDELTSVERVSWQARHAVAQRMMSRLRPLFVQARLYENSDGDVHLLEFKGTVTGMILSMQYHFKETLSSMRTPEKEVQQDPPTGVSQQKGKMKRDNTVAGEEQTKDKGGKGGHPAVDEEGKKGRTGKGVRELSEAKGDFKVIRERGMDSFTNGMGVPQKNGKGKHELMNGKGLLQKSGRGKSDAANVKGYSEYKGKGREKGKSEYADAKGFSESKGFRREKGKSEFADVQHFPESKGSKQGKSNGFSKGTHDDTSFGKGKGKDRSNQLQSMTAEGKSNGLSKGAHDDTSFGKGKGKDGSKQLQSMTSSYQHTGSRGKIRIRKIYNLEPGDKGFNVIVKSLKVKFLPRDNDRRWLEDAVALVGDSTGVIQMRCTEEQAFFLQQYEGSADALLMRDCQIFMELGHMKLEVSPAGIVEEAPRAPDFTPLRSLNMSLTEYELI